MCGCVVVIALFLLSRAEKGTFTFTLGRRPSHHRVEGPAGTPRAPCANTNQVRVLARIGTVVQSLRWERSERRPS